METKPSLREVAEGFHTYHLNSFKLLECMEAKEDVTIRLQNYNSKEILNKLPMDLIIGVNSKGIKVKYRSIVINITG